MFLRLEHLTAIDVNISKDFAAMSEMGLVDRIEDHSIYNWFRTDGDGELNVHAEYGYLMNDVTAGIIADWWSRHR